MHHLPLSKRFLCSLLTLIALTTTGGLLIPTKTAADDETSGATPSDSNLSIALALESALVGAIGRAEQSVVAIARGRQSDVAKLQDPQFVPYEYCAGVIVDPTGLILTNYHSLGDVEKNAYVVWHQRRAYNNVTVKAADPWTDLAILKIDGRELPPIPLGNAQDLKKGRIVISLGNPYAIARDGDVSATWGIVSNIGRKIDGPLPGMSGKGGPETVDPRRRETLYHYGGLIQTDAKLAKNTSGGPLLDLNGNMVGLSTSIATLAGFEKGTGYAIPVDARFLSNLKKLKEGKEIENGFLGVAPRNPILGQDERGVILESVEAGTPAAIAGLATFDEVIRIDDTEIKTVDDLFFKVGATPPGQTVVVTLRSPRALLPDKLEQKQVRLTKKPNTGSRPIIASAPKRSWLGMQIDFGTALSLTRLASLDPTGCLIVTQVDVDSAAWAAGFRRGTVISAVNGQSVAAPDEFFDLLQQTVEGEDEMVEITVFERGEYRKVLVSTAESEVLQP